MKVAEAHERIKALVPAAQLEQASKAIKEVVMSVKGLTETDVTGMFGALYQSLGGVDKAAELLPLASKYQFAMSTEFGSKFTPEQLREQAAGGFEFLEKAGLVDAAKSAANLHSALGDAGDALTGLSEGAAGFSSSLSNPIQPWISHAHPATGRGTSIFRLGDSSNGFGGISDGFKISSGVFGGVNMRSPGAEMGEALASLATVGFRQEGGEEGQEGLGKLGKKTRGSVGDAAADIIVGKLNPKKKPKSVGRAFLQGAKTGAEKGLLAALFSGEEDLPATVGFGALGGGLSSAGDYLWEKWFGGEEDEAKEQKELYNFSIETRKNLSAEKILSDLAGTVLLPRAQRRRAIENILSNGEKPIQELMSLSCGGSGGI